MRSLCRHLLIDLLRLLVFLIVLASSSVLLVLQLLPALFAIELGTDIPLPQDFLTLGMITGSVLLCITGFSLTIPNLVDGIFDLVFRSRVPSAREQAQLDAMLTRYQAIVAEKKGKIPRFRLRILDHSDLNAVAYGQCTVALTTGLLDHVKKTDQMDQLVAVFAHELGHIVNQDIRFAAAIRSMTSVLDLLAFLLRPFLMIPLVGLVFGLVLFVASLPIRIALFIYELSSRAQEYRADEYAAYVVGPERMMAFFEDIAPLQQPPELGLHAFFKETHPPTELRRDRLERMMAPVEPPLPAAEPEHP